MHNMGLTDSGRVHPLRLLDEAVDFAHLVDTRLCPAFPVNGFFDFFSKRFHVFRKGGQIIECMRETLPQFLKTGVDNSYERNIPSRMCGSLRS
jgi:hypothetical protein